MALADALENLQPGPGETDAYITPADVAAALTEIYTTAPGTVAPPVEFGSWQASSTAAITSATWPVILWDQTIGATPGLSIVSGSRITTTADGVFHLEAAAAWTGSSGNARQLELRKNSAGSRGGTLLRNVVSAGIAGTSAACVTALSWDIRLVAGDYLELYRFQNSGANLAPANNEGATLRPASATLRWVGL